LVLVRPDLPLKQLDYLFCSVRVAFLQFLPPLFHKFAQRRVIDIGIELSIRLPLKTGEIAPDLDGCSLMFRHSLTDCQ